MRLRLLLLLAVASCGRAQRTATLEIAPGTDEAARVKKRTSNNAPSTRPVFSEASDAR